MAVIDQLPSGKWRARVRRRDSRPQSKTFLHKIDAEGWARKTESAIERGVWHDNTKAESTTLADALDQYEEDVLPRMRGKRGEKSIIGILREEPEADTPLSKIDGTVIVAMRDRWSAAKYKPGTIHRRFHTLSHLFTVAAREWGMRTLVNPLREVQLPPEDNSRDRRVSDAELSALREASDSDHLGDFITLAVETAMRRTELVDAEWCDVNLDAATWRIPQPIGGNAKTKNRTGRTVPLSPTAVATLTAMRERGAGKERVFTGWAAPDSATQAFKRARRRARKRYVATCHKDGETPDRAFLINLRVHDLRHEAMSRLSERYGFGPHELAKIAGQKTLRMVMRYFHPRAEDFAARMREEPAKTGGAARQGSAGPRKVPRKQLRGKSHAAGKTLTRKRVVGNKSKPSKARTPGRVRKRSKEAFP